MPRKTLAVTVPRFDGTDNRDEGKTFLITEWPAAAAEKWGIRMMLAYNRSGGDIPLDLRGIGMEGIAIIGLNTFLRGNVQSDEVIPLLDQLLECVTVIRDPHFPDVATAFHDDDTEEVATRLWLRGEVLSLHINFSVKDALTSLIRTIMTKAPGDSSATPTSPPESGP
jgi:hypothetical protein